MDYEERIKREKSLDYPVVKGNDLIQRSRFKLSKIEQKTVAYICSKIKPVEKGEKPELELTFDIMDYCQLCGLDFDNGGNYTNVKNSLKKLSDKSMWLKEGKVEKLCRWLAKVTINENSGKVIVELDRDLVPYLFDLKEQFTQFQLREVLGMKSKYAIRLFELLKSYEYQKSKTFDVPYLRKMLGIEDVKSYDNYKDFKKRVLDPAIEEINRLTYLRVTFETERGGRGGKVQKIKFRMHYTEDARERNKAWREQDKALGLNEWD